MLAGTILLFYLFISIIIHLFFVLLPQIFPISRRFVAQKIVIPEKSEYLLLGDDDIFSDNVTIVETDLY